MPLTDLISLVSTVNNQAVTYGKEWNFYAGILFGFEILNFNQSPKRRYKGCKMTII